MGVFVYLSELGLYNVSGQRQDKLRNSVSDRRQRRRALGTIAISPHPPSLESINYHKRLARRDSSRGVE